MIVQHSSSSALRSYSCDDQSMEDWSKPKFSHGIKAFEILEGVHCSDQRTLSNTGYHYSVEQSTRAPFECAHEQSITTGRPSGHTYNDFA
jgi:hypothetical protein